MRDVSIEFTDDNPSALGTIDLKTMTVRLNGLLLLEGNEALLMETLCHELAHATTACRYGLSAPEHGPEWQEFMERAGFKPRAVIPLSEIR